MIEYFHNIMKLPDEIGHEMDLLRDDNSTCRVRVDNRTNPILNNACLDFPDGFIRDRDRNFEIFDLKDSKFRMFKMKMMAMGVWV